MRKFLAVVILAAAAALLIPATPVAAEPLLNNGIGYHVGPDLDTLGRNLISFMCQCQF